MTVRRSFESSEKLPELLDKIISEAERLTAKAEVTPAKVKEMTGEGIEMGPLGFQRFVRQQR